MRFWTASALVTQMLEARQARQLERLLRNLERHHLVVLDELGYVPFSKAGAELLFDVVSHAYERASLIVTTNLPFEQWTEVLGSERLTGAMLDRLTHRVHIIEANGESYRLKESRRRLKHHLHAIAFVTGLEDVDTASQAGLVRCCGGAGLSIDCRVNYISFLFNYYVPVARSLRCAPEDRQRHGS
ncbi:unnamed protein product [marine sediment metagenome]|uniref:IstB-like ATP-binding domain-containing protein n=1 Tax=marine sediment metagenome TaxID=412755 RepID=X0T080_9ZZZZ